MLTIQEIEIINTKRRLSSFDETLRDKLQTMFYWASTYGEIKYCITNNIISHPRCQHCGTIYAKFSTGNWEYDKYCSTSCKNIGKTANIKNTMLSIYGVDHNFKLQSQRNIRAETWIKKYGTDNPSKSQIIINKIRDTKEQRYGNGGYNNIAKTKETCIYKYGTNYFIECDEFKTKSNITRIIKYGNISYNNREKSELTCLDKYGVKHISQNEDVHLLQQKHRWYEIITPSNKTIKIQGYERYVIPILWEKYDENIIILSRKVIPPIWYYDINNKLHRYFADGFIQSTNTIIEIKSRWTLKQSKEKMLNIIQTLEESNINLMLLIYDPQTKEIFEYDLVTAKNLISQL